MADKQKSQAKAQTAPERAPGEQSAEEIHAARREGEQASQKASGLGRHGEQENRTA